MFHKKNGILLVIFVGLALCVILVLKWENQDSDKSTSEDDKRVAAIPSSSTPVLNEAKNKSRALAVQAPTQSFSVKAAPVPSPPTNDQELDSAPHIVHPGLSALHDRRILSMKETKPDPRGNFTRIKVLSAKGKRGLVRLEEKLNKNFSTGEEQMVGQSAMLAEQLMVKLQSGYSSSDLAALTQKFGYKILRTVPLSNIFLVSFDGKDPDALSRVQANLNNSKIVEKAGPDYLYFAN